MAAFSSSVVPVKLAMIVSMVRGVSCSRDFSCILVENGEVERGVYKSELRMSWVSWSITCLFSF